MKIYLPKPINAKPYTVGEKCFFNNKFWKLAVMNGYDWRSLNVIKTGFSFINFYTKSIDDKINNIIDFLVENNIKFRIEQSKSKWTYKIIISTKKSGLETIDKLYVNFYQSRKNEYKELYEHNNYFIDKIEYDTYKN